MSRSLRILKSCKDPTCDSLRPRLLPGVGGGKGYLPAGTDTLVDVSPISIIHQPVRYVEKRLEWIGSRSCTSTPMFPESEKRPCRRLGDWYSVYPDAHAMK